MRQWERMTHFSMAARARFVVVHVLFKGTWTQPLQWGCVNKRRAHKSIFKHYLFPIALNVHTPRSCFLKIKNSVRSHHPQRPNPCTPEFFTFQRQGGSAWHGPARAACARRGAAAWQNRTMPCMQGTLADTGTGASPEAAPRSSASKGAEGRDRKGISTALSIEKSSF